MPQTAEHATAITAAHTPGQLWLAQFIYDDGATLVHLCSSKEQAYQALADEDGLEVQESQTAEERIAEHFADGNNGAIYVVAQVDSVNL